MDKSDFTNSHPNTLDYYTHLYKNCGDVLNKSLSGKLLMDHSVSHNFISDYAQWLDCLHSRSEVVLYQRAISEYQFALLALTMGLYRQAFTSLRLFLELSLAGIYFSANELELREWFHGDQDIRWSVLKDQNNGIFSKRFVRAFYAELDEIVSQYGGIAEATYRECSEFVHGNAYTHDILSGHLEFKELVFKEWHQKAQSIHLVVLFTFCVRYLHGFDGVNRAKLETVILENLGHVSEIRRLFEVTAKDE